MHKYRAVIPMIFAALLVTALPAVAQRGDDASRASKNGMVEGMIDGVTVTLEYGRPNVKGRTVWGDLVPYGKVWRTGADEATTITFSADVEIEGETLAAGSYSLFTEPGENEWTVIFNKATGQWGTRYDGGQDALRVTATPKAVEHVEAMNFELVDSWVVLRWEKLAIPFEVKKSG